MELILILIIVFILILLMRSLNKFLELSKQYKDLHLDYASLYDKHQKYKDNNIHQLLYHKKWSQIRNLFIIDLINSGRVTRAHYNTLKIKLEKKYDQERKNNEIKD